MTTEKRGSEKLLDAEGELCALTPDELSQVSGALGPFILGPGDSFPLGTVNPDLFKELIVNDHLLNTNRLIGVGELSGIDARADKF